MYSRNLTVDGSISGIRLTPGTKPDKVKFERENIPVKSFTDSFAYDRFNRMGNDVQNKTKESHNNAEYVSDENESSAVTETANQEEKAIQTVSDTSIERSESEEKTTNLFGKLKLLFDTDTVIIILAVTILLLSDNATNDKLTPFALLAILLF